MTTLSRKIRWASWIRRGLSFGSLNSLALFVLLGAGCAAESDRPKFGINLFYVNPNPETWTKLLETESREVYKNRNEIVSALGLKPGMDVGDVGAGTGLFTRLIAPKVAPDGTVFAVDIAQNFLDHIAKTTAEKSITNVKTVLCDQTSTKLAAESVDLVFVCDTYHHFEHPAETLASIRQALRPDGSLVIVDFERIPGKTSLWILDHVRCGKQTVVKEVTEAGFAVDKEIEMMASQFMIRFKKKAKSAASAAQRIERRRAG